MMKQSAGLCACLLLATVAIAQPAAPVRLAADEWPPFVSHDLPGNGVTGSIASAVFEKQNQQLTVEYFPWKRAMQLGLSDVRYAGFMAVWRTAEREKLCHFSAPIGSTQTVLVHLKETPLQVASLADLRDVRIGTVAGYANGEQFDDMVKRGELKVDEGLNDEINLKKLLIKRFPVIVIEKHVLRYLLSSRQFSQAERERIAVIENVFKERSVHICFKRSPQGEAQQKSFNNAAREIDVKKIEREYWKRNGNGDGAASGLGW